jgi:hypothetical protein
LPKFLPGIIISLKKMTMSECPCVLTYDMLELGSKMFNFISDDEAYHFQRENPPGPTVKYTYLEYGDVRFRERNRSFSGPVYNTAVEEKRWRDHLLEIMGRTWQEAASKEGSSNRDPRFDGEKTNLDRDALTKRLCGILTA